MSNKAWCIRCRDITYPIDIEVEIDRSGYPIAKGTCPICNAQTRKIMSKKEAKA